MNVEKIASVPLMLITSRHNGHSDEHNGSLYP